MSKAIHDKKQTLKVDVNGHWKMYTMAIPAGSVVIGTVSRGYNTGALIRYKSGMYAQINVNCISSLSQKDVIAALS